MKRSIILVGIKGSGKSTHGKALANHLKVPFYDIDALIDGDVVNIDYIKTNHGVALNTFSLGLDSLQIRRQLSG